MIKNILLVAILMGVVNRNFAQTFSSEAIVSGGGFTSTSSGSLSYSIGEAAITTYVKSNATLTQGFQQGFLSNPGSDILNLSVNGFKVDLFPNPASTSIELNISAPKSSEVNFSIYNILGASICEVQNIYHNGFEFQTFQNIFQYTDGIYFAVVKISDPSTGSIHSITKKFVIHH